MARVSTRLSRQRQAGPARTIVEKVDNAYGHVGNMRGVLPAPPCAAAAAAV